MAQAAVMQKLAEEHPQGLAPFLKVPDPKRRQGLARLVPDWLLARQVLRVAVPVIVGMLTQTAINILDTIMVGRLPKEAANPGQAAIGLALPMMWLVGGFLSAVWVGTQAITSRRAGEGNDSLAGRALTNSVVIAFTSAIAFSSIAYFVAPYVIGAMYRDPVVVQLASDYLQIRMVGVLAMVATFSFKSFFDGIGKTHVFMSAAVGMNLMNVALNWLFIYGNETLGIPHWGVSGAAYASVTSAYLGLVVLIIWSLTPTYLGRYHYYSAKKLSLRVVRDIIRLSLPNGLATIVVMLGFEAFYWVVGQVNARYATAGNPVIATANQVLITIFMLTFMSSLAVGSATAAVVSQTLGAKRPVLGEAYAWVACKVWAYVMWIYGAVMFLFPDALLGLVTTDPDVMVVGRLPLQVLALLQGFMAIAIILAQTLYGVGNAKFVMYVELCLHLCIMAPVAYLCGWVLDWGLLGVFVGPVSYISLLCIAMVWKFRRGEWKEIEI